MNRYLYFSEGQSYPVSNFPRLVETLGGDELYMHVSSGRFSWQVSGFAIVENTPVIVFPKNYTLPEREEDMREETMMLLRSLLRYRNEHDFETEDSELLFGDTLNDSSRIASAIYIIEDFLQYGLITRTREITSSTRPGKTDWARTIRLKQPLISEGDVIYMQRVTRVNTFDAGNIIRQIHQCIVGDCASLWGWLLQYESSEGGIEQLPCSCEEAIRLMRKELSVTYVQREITLLKTMIEYLSAVKGAQENGKKEFLCTPYFHWIWEAICGYLFENEYSRLKVHIPSPEWHVKNLPSNISQRPDILFRKEKKLYILDAKYYNYYRNLPGWHDVVKQFFYRETIKAVLTGSRIPEDFQGIQEIENLFVFPGEGNSDLEYLGFVDVAGVPNLGVVKAFAVNSRKAIRAYALREESFFKDELVSVLNSNIQLGI